MKTLVTLACAIAVIATSTDVLTASPDRSPRGEGATAVSGFEISNVSHELDVENPLLMDSVNFTIDRPFDGAFRVSLGPAEWHPCSVTGVRVRCSTGGTPVATATELRVITA